MCVPKSNSNDRYAITCDVIVYHLVHFVSIRLINKCQSGIDFSFTSERAIYPSFVKISVPSPVFRGITLWWKWNFAKSTRSNVNKGMRFASGTIKYASLIFLKGRRWECKNMQAHSRWLHAIRKGVITEKKTWHKKVWKYAIVFASTQLRLTRLRKYPIDPKAYLGRWIIFDLESGHLFKCWIFINKGPNLLKAWCDMDHYRTYRRHHGSKKCD